MTFKYFRKKLYFYILFLRILEHSGLLKKRDQITKQLATFAEYHDFSPVCAIKLPLNASIPSTFVETFYIEANFSYLYLALELLEAFFSVYVVLCTLGIQIRNMKMVFNFYCSWRWVTFEKLMMKIYDFFYSAPYNIV